jgi:CRP-like cAMP-binding protein
MLVTLHKKPEFSRLSIDCVAKLYGAAVPCSYAKHDFILRQGDEADGLYIMLSGAAKVSLENDGGQVAILNLVRPGDMFGEIALLDGGRRMASVVALDTVQLLKVAKTDFFALASEHPELIQSIARYVCGHVRHADRKIGELTLLGLQERVIRQLRDLASKDGAGRLVVSDAISQRDIADMVGASRERVSKALHALYRSGKVSAEGKILVIHPEPAQHPAPQAEGRQASV